MHSRGRWFDPITLHFSVAQLVELITVNNADEVQNLAGKNMLSILFLIPCLGLLLIAFLPAKRAVSLSLYTTVLTFLYSVYLSSLVDSSKSMQLLDSLAGLTIGVDGISVSFILLTTVIMPITVLVSRDYIKNEVKVFYVALISVELLLIGVFSILDLFGFYIFYEAILIPMVLIIGV